MNSMNEGIFVKRVSNEEVVLTIVYKVVCGQFLPGSIRYVMGQHWLDSLGGLMFNTNGATFDIVFPHQFWASRH